MQPEPLAFAERGGVLERIHRAGVRRPGVHNHTKRPQSTGAIIRDGLLNGNQPQALSEGWSDYFAASFTGDPLIGAWVSGQPGGMRQFPIGQSPFTISEGW